MTESGQDWKNIGALDNLNILNWKFNIIEQIGKNILY